MTKLNERQMTMLYTINQITDGKAMTVKGSPLAKLDERVLKVLHRHGLIGYRGEAGVNLVYFITEEGATLLHLHSADWTAIPKEDQ